jgi:acyl-CoA reductase-like NAD-dependent aldehyde dehydrogenase
VVAISAFNHPLNLIVHQVAPAVAVGCPVIVKPADDTPMSARSFVDMLTEAGLPPGWCEFIACDIPTSEQLVTDPRVAFLSFIGSARVGWMLRSKLAPGTRCALEHGGAAPVIVDDSADLESMIPLLAKGGSITPARYACRCSASLRRRRRRGRSRRSWRFRPTP